MALQIWCPFTSDTKQQGLGDISIPISASQGSIVTNGKLGKCLKTATSAIDMNYTPDINNSSISFGGWFKVNKAELQTVMDGITFTDVRSTPTGNLIGNNSYGGLGLIWSTNNLYTTANKEVQTFIAYPYLRTPTKSVTTSYFTLSFDTWYHIFVVWDLENSKLLYYKNGELYTQATIGGFTDAPSRTFNINSSQVGGGNGPGVNIPFYTNDIRVYDRALAPKEIEILSRGLVCHYPLNNNGGGQPNLYDFESVANKWAVEGLTLANATDEVYGNVLKITSPSSVSSQRIYRTVSNVWKADTKFTVSFLAKASKTAVVKMSRSLANYAPDVTVGTTWKRYSTVITCSTTVEGGTLSIQTSTASADIYLTQIKLELGDKATTYCPGVGDSHYIPLGYDSTTEYDVSGYGNNMTKTGTITYTSDSARYSVASHFINGSYIMANQNCGEYLPKDSLTVNIWVKPTTWSNPISCTEGGGWNIEESGSGLQFQCYISGVGYKPAKCSVTGSSLVDSKWHMLTGVFDRAAQQTKFYIDGELKATGSTGSTNGVGYVSNRLIISGEAQSTTPASSAFVGEESDVRIYATALSATQVAELYNTAVSVANNGTLMGYELVEG